MDSDRSVVKSVVIATIVIKLRNCYKKTGKTKSKRGRGGWLPPIYIGNGDYKLNLEG